MSPEPTALLMAPEVDVILIDGRTDLPAVRSLCRLMETTGNTSPVILITTEGGLAAVNREWGLTDVLLVDASPAEIEVRIRLATTKAATTQNFELSGEIKAGELLIDEATYSAKLRGRTLDLTFKEFELLKFLAQHPGRVFSRDALLTEVWGYRHSTDTRLVNVHIQRLRAKIEHDAEHPEIVVTIRGVGYKAGVMGGS